MAFNLDKGKKNAKDINEILSDINRKQEASLKIEKERLKIEKDNFILITGPVGSGKSTLAGKICFTQAMNEINFIKYHPFTSANKTCAIYGAVVYFYHQIIP